MPEVWVDADHWISQAKEHLREKGFVVVEKARLEALERITNKADLITSFMIRRSGEPIDGFRFRELMLEIRKELEAMEK